MGQAETNNNAAAFGQPRVPAGESQGAFANAMAQGEQALGSQQPEQPNQEGVTIPPQQEQAQPQGQQQHSYQALPDNYGNTPEFQQGNMPVDQQNINQIQAVDQSQQPIGEQGVVQPQEEQRSWQGSYDKEVDNHKQTQSKLQFMEQQNLQMAEMYKQTMFNQSQPQAPQPQPIVENSPPDLYDFIQKDDYDADESRTPGTSSFNAYNNFISETNNFNTRRVVQEEYAKNEEVKTRSNLHAEMDRFATANPRLNLKDAFGNTNYNKIQTDMGSYLTASNVGTIMDQMYRQADPNNVPIQQQQPQAINNNVGGANNLASKANDPQSVASTTGASTGSKPRTQLDNLRGYYGNQFGSGSNRAFPSGGNHIVYNK